MKGNYAVLTPEKIEDLFKDLIEKVNKECHWFPVTQYKMIDILESKKQELLKSIGESK